MSMPTCIAKKATTATQGIGISVPEKLPFKELFKRSAMQSPKNFSPQKNLPAGDPGFVFAKQALQPLTYFP